MNWNFTSAIAENILSILSTELDSHDDMNSSFEFARCYVPL